MNKHTMMYHFKTHDQKAWPTEWKNYLNRLSFKNAKALEGGELRGDSMKIYV